MNDNTHFAISNLKADLHCGFNHATTAINLNNHYFISLISK